MNERIRELAEQAGLLPKQLGPSVETRHMKKKEKDLEDFAELIVEECADWIVDNAGAMEHLGPSYFAKAMKKDFGVEE
jgi:hypothetical protein